MYFAFDEFHVLCFTPVGLNDTVFANAAVRILTVKRNLTYVLYILQLLSIKL
jgi:hypothetical protein